MQSVTKGIASEKTILVPLELPKNTCKTPKSSVPVLSVSFLKPVLQNPGFPRVLRISGQLLWSSGAPMLARCMADRGVGFRVAGGDDDDSYSARKLTTLGCKHVSILHTRDPAVADSDQQVLKMLDEANGIWIDGGRTYRVMEAYENTQVQKKIYAILQRGGVFGGSSAGCQLASEFLVRGNPETSDQLEFPLYNRGLGLLTGVILDAHFRQRHREYEFGYLVLLHPELLGIGVDEGTSIVVKGEIATVVGANGVTFFDATKPVSNGGNFSVPTQTFLKSGSRFNLRTRQPIP